MTQKPEKLYEHDAFRDVCQNRVCITKGLKEASSVRPPLDGSEIKAEGTLLTRFTVIVVKDSIPHSKL